MTVVSRGSDVVLLEITDQGGEWDASRPKADSTLGGRGLAIVAALATDWGVLGDRAGRTVWFQFKWVQFK